MSLVFDLEKELVWKNGKLIRLSSQQYLLLVELYKKDGGVISCKELIKAVYGEELNEKAASTDRRLRNLVERTRERIEETGTTHESLQIIAGQGYRLNPVFAGDPTTDAPPPEKKKDK